MRRCEKTGDLFIRDWENNPIITKKEVEEKLSRPVNSVFNAGVTFFNEHFILLLRVECRQGLSSLVVAKSRDGISNWEFDSNSIFPPEGDKFGVEDARVAFLEELDCYAIVYTDYSEDGYGVALAITEDFVHFRRLGLVLPPSNKDAALFPRRIKGKFWMISRPEVPKKPGMWISCTDVIKDSDISPRRLCYWGEPRLLMKPRSGNFWDSFKIGLNTPPLETPEGWLGIFHGVKPAGSSNLYRLGLFMLDLDNPAKVTHRTREFVMSPYGRWERTGDMLNAIFPCGWYKNKEEITIYYGAADTVICRATASFNDILDCILSSPV